MSMILLDVRCSRCSWKTDSDIHQRIQATSFGGYPSLTLRYPETRSETHLKSMVSQGRKPDHLNQPSIFRGETVNFQGLGYRGTAYRLRLAVSGVRTSWQIGPYPFGGFLHRWSFCGPCLRLKKKRYRYRTCVLRYKTVAYHDFQWQISCCFSTKTWTCKS